MGSPPPAKKMRVADLLGVTHETFNIDHDETLLKADGTWEAAQAITKQIPHDTIPLTILTGFLGAGKSTVLNYILRADHGLRIAVLINEFGKVDIDNQLVDTAAEGEEGEPITLNNGCICCTVSNGFIDAVKRILARPGPSPHYFIVETTGLADPKPIMDSISATELRQQMYVDQVLTVIDASTWDESHYDSDTAFKQLEFADTILLSKTDIATQDRISDAVDCIVDLRPNARILRSQKGYVPVAALFDLDIVRRKTEAKEHIKGNKNHIHANAVQNSVNNNTKDATTNSSQNAKQNGTNENHNHDHKHDHNSNENKDCGHNHAPGEECGETHQKDKGRNHLEEEGFTSISFTSDKPFSLRRFRDEFMDSLPPGVFRAKGLLWFRHYDARFIFHWSGARYNVEEGEWPEGVKPSNQLVVIGRQLDAPTITSMLEECVLRDGEEDDDDEEYYDEEEDGRKEDDEQDINAAVYGPQAPQPLLNVTGAPADPKVMTVPVPEPGQTTPQHASVIPVQSNPLQPSKAPAQEASVNGTGAPANIA